MCPAPTQYAGTLAGCVKGFIAETIKSLITSDFLWNGLT